MVDEYAHINSCVEGLLEMMRAFLEPTFKLLEIKAQQLNNNEVLLTLKHHPDTVDDFFRLNARFLQRAALPYLKCDFVPSIIECALVAVLLGNIKFKYYITNAYHNELKRGKKFILAGQCTVFLKD